VEGPNEEKYEIFGRRREDTDTTGVLIRGQRILRKVQ
jgi:hypothetical protein